MDEKTKKKNWFARHKILTVILAVIAIGVLASALSGSEGTENSNTNTSSGSSESTPEKSQDEVKEESFDLDKAYAKIANGMTKEQVEKATGKESESCTETEDPTFGKTEICSYGNAFIDKGAITVTYSQDKVSSKSKSKY